MTLYGVGVSLLFLCLLLSLIQKNRHSMLSCIAFAIPPLVVETLPVIDVWYFATSAIGQILCIIAIVMIVKATCLSKLIQRLAKICFLLITMNIASIVIFVLFNEGFMQSMYSFNTLAGIAAYILAALSMMWGRYGSDRVDSKLYYNGSSLVECFHFCIRKAKDLS